MFDLRVWVDVEADGNTLTTTPGKGKDSNKNQMQRLAKLAKKHRNGQVPKVDWLDRLTFREIEMINEKEKTQSANHLFLLIEFQTVMFNDHTVSFVLGLHVLNFILIGFFFPSSIQLYTMNQMEIEYIRLFQSQNL